MLSKLLKYEFKATGRVMLPVLIALLAVSGLLNLCGSVAEHTRSQIISLITGMLGFVYVMAILAIGVVALVAVIYRFYKNLLTDEGYLMFTLPVNVHGLVWAKLIAAVVWLVAAFADIVLSIFVLVAPLRLGWGAEFVQFMGQFFHELAAAGINGFEVAAFALELLLIVVLGIIGSCLVFYTAMSIGYSFANHKALLSVGFYFGIGFVTQVLGVSLLIGLGTALDGVEFNFVYTLRNALNLGHATLLGICLLELLYDGALYFGTTFMLKRRLNLP